nr:hypothetical protein [Tanacetum cinerariifolium]
MHQEINAAGSSITAAVGGYDSSFQADEEPFNYALMVYASSGSSSSSRSDNEVAPCSKACSKAYVTLQTHYDNLIVEFKKSQFDVLSYKTGLESVGARLVVYQKNENVFEEDIKLLKLDVMLRDNALVELRKKFEKERNDLKLTLEKFQTSSKNLSKLLECQVNDKTGLGFDSQVFNSQVFDCEELYSHESDNSVPKNLQNDRYKTGEEYHDVPPPYTRNFMPLKPDLVFNDALTASESVANVFNVELSTNKPTKDMSKTHRPDAPIIKDWIFESEDETEIESVPKQKQPSFVPTTEHVKTPREFVKQVEHLKQAENLRKNNKHSLTRSRLVSLNAARPVPTVVPQSTMQSSRLVKHVVNKGNPQQAQKDKGVIDSGCSRHMTGNISFLSDFDEINGRYVAFRGNPKGGKISGKASTPIEIEKPLLKDPDGIGPKRLFDIDTLTKSMNYQPFVAGNQPNDNAGLQVKQKDNGIFISQDKYVAKILRKFGLIDDESASTPIDTEKPLLKDPNGEDVDVHIYS